MVGRQKRGTVVPENFQTRTGTRIRIQKQFPDFIDASFSESEPCVLAPIPRLSTGNTNKNRGGGGRGNRGAKAGEKRNVKNKNQTEPIDKRVQLGEDTINTRVTDQYTPEWNFEETNDSSSSFGTTVATIESQEPQPFRNDNQIVRTERYLLCPVPPLPDEESQIMTYDSFVPSNLPLPSSGAPSIHRVDNETESNMFEQSNSTHSLQEMNPYQSQTQDSVNSSTIDTEEISTTLESTSGISQERLPPADRTQTPFHPEENNQDGFQESTGRPPSAYQQAGGNFFDCHLNNLPSSAFQPNGRIQVDSLGCATEQSTAFEPERMRQQDLQPSSHRPAVVFQSDGRNQVEFPQGNSNAFQLDNRSQQNFQSVSQQPFQSIARNQGDYQQDDNQTLSTLGPEGRRQEDFPPSARHQSNTFELYGRTQVDPQQSARRPLSSFQLNETRHEVFESSSHQPSDSYQSDGRNKDGSQQITSKPSSAFHQDRRREPESQQSSRRPPTAFQPDSRRQPEFQPDGRSQQDLQPIGRKQQEIQPSGRRQQELQPSGRRQPELQPNGRRQQELQPSGRRQQELQPNGTRQQELQPSGRRQPELQPNGRRQQELQPSGRRQQELQPNGTRQQELQPSGRRQEQELQPDGRYQEQFPLQGQSQPNKRGRQGIPPRLNRGVGELSMESRNSRAFEFYESQPMQSEPHVSNRSNFFSPEESHEDGSQPWRRPQSNSQPVGKKSSQASLWPTEVFQEYVKNSLEYVKFRVKEINNKVECFIESKRSDCACTLAEKEAAYNLFKLPLESSDEVDELERMLNDISKLTQLKVLLLRIGGNTISTTVYNIMDRLFSRKMGASYTWTGKSKKGERKRVFKSLKNLKAAIFGAASGNIKIDEKDKSEEDIKFYITEWLRRSQEKVDGNGNGTDSNDDNAENEDEL